MIASRVGRAAGKRIGIFLAALLALSASAQEPSVRASLKTTGPVWTGQKVAMVLELYAPGYFASAATFDLPDAFGMILLPPNEHPTVSGRTIDGTYYTIQQYELAVYP